VTGLSKNNRDFAGWVIKVTKNPGTANTGGNTSWFFSFIQTLLTERAFISNTEFLINITSIIGTGRNTGLTTNAFFAVNLDCAVFLMM
jgi:hypothetical protein